MKDSSLNSTACARTRCDWKAATPRRTLTATRRRNDPCGGGVDSIGTDAAPRRLSRNQPRDGVALRGSAGDAGAKGERSGEIASSHCVRPRVGHRERGTCCYLARLSAAARSHPLHCRLDDALPWKLLSGAASSLAVGPNEGGIPGPDSLVVSDGFGAWRWFDGGAGIAGQ